MTMQKADMITTFSAPPKKSTVPALVKLQTTEILPGWKDQSVGGIGCVIDPAGLVLTSLHVLRNFESIHATLGNGDYYRAQVIVADPENDLALLQLKTPDSRLPVIPLQRTWNLSSGEKMIRSRYGLSLFLREKDQTMLSDLAREPDLFTEHTGGPLINSKGELAGMNFPVKRNHPGIRPAIPLLRLENILTKHLIPERFLNLSFGFIPRVSPRGRIFASRVFPDSPAHHAGIMPGMEIISFDGWDPKGDLLELSRRMIRVKAGQPVEIHVRGLDRISVAPIPFSQCSPHISMFWKLGITADTLTPANIPYFRPPVSSGVIVTSVESPMAAFRRGDVIVGWNRKKIQTIFDLKKELEHAPIGSRAFARVCSVVYDPEKGPLLVERVVPVMIQ